ncbi:unnamed protein product [Callosobruchus maculatus]|uniref:THIF-type NAD/FAD binding fold domain-containing protein n=1 Tax=Callosobruchus maculatus TaxID=64391 RepID=A0A653BH88_CALMS|nr:unnamed protein product [Callosobruchus maculatus]
MLNPLVKISADTDAPTSKDLTYFKKFTIIVATGIKSDLLLKIDKICRSEKIKLIFGDTFGMFGYTVSDFEKHIYYEDQVQLIGKKRKHDGAEKTTVKVKGEITYPELNKVIILPNTKQSADSIKKSKRRNELFYVMLALIEFRNRHNRNPTTSTKKEDIESLEKIKSEIFSLYQVDESKSKLSKDIFDIIFGEVVPICAVLGGVIAQEVIKAVSNKEVPINNVFLFDPIMYDGKEETVGV